MKITRKSTISGIVRVRNIPVDPEDYMAWEDGGAAIHDAMPYLSDEDRDFILSGITSEEWRAAWSLEMAS